MKHASLQLPASSPAAANLSAADFLGVLHPSGSRGRVSFFVLMGKDHHSTRKHDAAVAPTIVEAFLDTAAYVTMNRFHGPRDGSRLAQINALYLDLDVHGLLDSNQPHEHWAEQFQSDLVRKSLPMPSLLAFTGRGLCAIWLLEPLPAKALPRWSAAIRALIGLFRHLGADTRCSDTVRAFRIPGTPTRNQAWRYARSVARLVEYFDAVKVGLTATPALHTAQIFGDPIYRDSYREAVIDGWLIDHDPPHLIKTALSEAGITIEAGETIDVLDPRTGEIDTTTFPDQLDFTVEHFNRRTRAPKFNQVVAEEIARRVDIMSPDAGKTLVFATSDDHADEVVQYLRLAYRGEGLEIRDNMIQKITGSIDKPGKLILKYKNEADPRIAVTVDLLTTGIDVPSITNLVFLRRVNSRILYDQMIGRATRRCDEIGKEAFQIYDAVDLYPNLQAMTEMRPVVVDPKVSFETLFDRFESADSPSHQEEILDQIIVKLSRKIRHMNHEIREQYTAQAGETLKEIRVA